jgi:ABC-type transporter Mla subunit MlaD
MAKKDKKDKKDGGRSDAVRTAVDQAFQATAEQAETARGRAQDIVDEFAQAAGRVRDALEELRPPTGDEVKSLRETVARLEARVAKLEAEAAKPKPKPRAPARRTAPRTPKKPASGGTS